MKYYAVKNGRQTGIFTSWSECSASVKGFSGASYKSFSSKADAEKFLFEHDEKMYNEDNFDISVDLAEGYLVAFCDGSFSDELNAYSFGIVLIDLDRCEYTLNETDKTPEFLSARNVSGEVFGALCSIAWAASHGYKKLKIYHDYEGISKWITG